MSKQFLSEPSDESFANPTIIEALCELHFSCDGNSSEDVWQGKWFARFLTQLGISEYEMEPKKLDIHFHISSDGLSRVTSKPVDVGHMIYKHKQESHLIQLTPWKLTINEIENYQGWKVFLNHIHHSWISLTRVVEPIRLNRIGMRYINKIPRHNEEPLKEWINDTGLLSKEILEQKTNFFQRSELLKSEDTKLILTVAEEKSSIPSAIIFDIDVVKVKNFNPDWNSLSFELSLIHGDIRQVFDSSRTEKYSQFLKKGII